MKLNVRCCCSPKKVFGTIDLPVTEPCTVRVALYADREVDDYIKQLVKDDEFEIRDAIVSVKYIYDSISPNWRELAVFSDDRPIEFWRQVVGFKESTEVTIT